MRLTKEQSKFLYEKLMDATVKSNQKIDNIKQDKSAKSDSLVKAFNDLEDELRMRAIFENDTELNAIYLAFSLIVEATFKAFQDAIGIVNNSKEEF